MTVPFLDLKKQYQGIKDEIDSAVLETLASAQFILGPQVAGFEKEFAAYCHSDECVAVNSGTSALHLALLAAGIGPGDEVITTPFTFVATVAAILYSGATPVFVDIEPITCTMDTDQIEKAVTAHTKAILPVHLHGQTAEMDPILELAKRKGLIVIEDAAQAHGAEYKGHRAGSMGEIGCFSFYPGKNLGACGEGGAVTTSNPEYAKKIRILRDWGAEKKYQHDLAGYNYRMDGVQGAILNVKLRYLQKWTEARRAHAKKYDELLSGCGVDTPAAKTHNRHVYHVYAVRHPQRETIARNLLEKDVHTGIHYPIPVHLQKAYTGLGYKPGDFPNSEKAANETLSLPMFPELTAGQAEKVANAVKESVERVGL